MEEKQRVQIPRVKLGSQGLEVPRLGLGCAGLSGGLNAPVSHESGCLLIKRAFEKGITFFDTADIYGQDHYNEIMIGKALKELPRDQIQLATKFGSARITGGQLAIRGTPNYVRECCEGSLRRLGVDYMDLYYQHRVDTTVAIEDTATHPRFTGENLEKNKVLYRKFADLAAKHGCTAPQLALAWLLDQGDGVIPIPGTRKVENLEDNIRSVALELSQDEMREICDVTAVNEVSGLRQIESFAKFSWRYAGTPAR